MQRFITFILLLVTASSFVLAQNTNTSSQSTNIKIELKKNDNNTGPIRTPLNIDIIVSYNSETRSIDIHYDGDAEGVVYLYHEEDLVGYESYINTSLPLPYTHGIYSIVIVSESWTAKGTIQL